MTISPEEVVDALRAAASKEFEKPNHEQAWTTCMLRALARLAPAEACVDPDVTLPRVGTGRAAKEFLWDLTISSWPRYSETEYLFPSYFEAADRPRLLLVAESEWGAANGRKKNGMAVMEDFAKLLSARAQLKVMVFGYYRDGQASFEQLQDLMTKLVCAAQDDADYVLYGVAWGREKQTKDSLIRRGLSSAVHTGP